jgi:hypothetical protein
VSHENSDHEIFGSPDEQMRAIMARHLCGWISGHGAPLDHFVVDAEMIMEEARKGGIRFQQRDND